MFTQISNVVTEAKAEYCNSVSLRYFIMKSDDPSSYSNEDKLYDVNQVKSAIENETIFNISGHETLTLKSLKLLKCHTCWVSLPLSHIIDKMCNNFLICAGFYFSIKTSTILQYIEEVVVEWEALGLALQLPYHIIEEIKMDHDTKKLEHFQCF